MPTDPKWLARARVMPELLFLDAETHDVVCRAIATEFERVDAARTAEVDRMRGERDVEMELNHRWNVAASAAGICGSEYVNYPERVFERVRTSTEVWHRMAIDTKAERDRLAAENATQALTIALLDNRIAQAATDQQDSNEAIHRLRDDRDRLAAENAVLKSSADQLSDLNANQQRQIHRLTADRDALAGRIAGHVT